MKKLLFITLGILFLISAIVWWFVSYQRNLAAVSSRRITSNTTTVPVTNGSSTLSNGNSLAKNSSTPKEDPKMKFIDLLLVAMNRKSLDFYGKIVDQHGDPVPGVTVTARVGMNISFTLSGGYNVTTKSDSSGLFKFTGIHGAGNGFTLQKDGYEFNQRLAVSSRPQDYVPDPKHPVIFPMWKLKGLEPMIHEKIHEYIPCDGSFTSFNLLNGRGWGPDQDLSIQLTRNPVNIEQGKLFDWSVTLSIPNGGLQENNDTYPNEAPADGYKSSITINMPADQKGWSSEIEKSMPIRLAPSATIYCVWVRDTGRLHRNMQTLVDITG